MQVTGIVVDREGRPVADARVELSNGMRTLSRADGRFAFRRLWRGAYEVWASKGVDLADKRRAGRDATLRLESAEVTTVQVTANETPVPGALVLVGARRLRTDRDGFVTLRAVPRDIARGRVIAEGYPEQEFAVHAQRYIELVGSPITYPPLPRLDRVEGTVRDARGAPIAHARVCYHRMRPHAEVASTFTDARGRYWFDVETTPHRGRVWARGSLIREVPAGGGVVDLEVMPTGRVEGRVANASGGVPRAVLRRADEAFARAASEGAMFACEDLPVGAYTAALSTGESVAFTVVAGQTVRPTIEVTQRRVEVRLTLPRHSLGNCAIEPVSPGAAIDPGTRSSRSTGASTSVEIPWVRPGTYRVSIDGATWRELVVAEAPDIQVFDLRTR